MEIFTVLTVFILIKHLGCRFRVFAKKEQPCQNNPKNSYPQRKVKHKPSGYLLSLICSFDETKNRHKFYRRKDCTKRFCNDLKELATEIINYEEKVMTILNDQEITIYES